MSWYVYNKRANIQLEIEKTTSTPQSDGEVFPTFREQITSRPTTHQKSNRELALAYRLYARWTSEMRA